MSKTCKNQRMKISVGAFNFIYSYHSVSVPFSRNLGTLSLGPINRVYERKGYRPKNLNFPRTKVRHKMVIFSKPDSFAFVV